MATETPTYAEEEANGRPANSRAASARVDNFVFILVMTFRCSERRAVSVNYSRELFSAGRRGVTLVICIRSPRGNARIGTGGGVGKMSGRRTKTGLAVKVFLARLRLLAKIQRC